MQADCCGLTPAGETLQYLRGEIGQSQQAADMPFPRPTDRAKSSNLRTARPTLGGAHLPLNQDFLAVVVLLMVSIWAEHFQEAEIAAFIGLQDLLVIQALIAPGPDSFRFYQRLLSYCDFCF